MTAVVNAFVMNVRVDLPFRSVVRNGFHSGADVYDGSLANLENYMANVSQFRSRRFVHAPEETSIP